MTDHAPDELLTRLRAADPASSLPPAEPDRLTELVEAAMSRTRRDVRSDTESRVTESRESGTRDRSPLTWLVAAAAVLLIAAAGVFGLGQRGDDSRPLAQRSVTQLGFVAPQGRCVPPQVGVLRRQDVAFGGRLVALVDGTATFDVSRWYAGGPSETAKVTAPSARLADLVRDADLQVGRDYLVAASGGAVTACGFSGPATARLQRLYDRAFG